MIAAGHLVPPRTFVIDVGVQDALRSVRRTATDFDMDEVAAILDKELITEAVIRHWREKAAERKTIVFCSTVAHAENVCEAFNAAGVRRCWSTGNCRMRTASGAWPTTRPARPRSWSTSRC